MRPGLFGKGCQTAGSSLSVQGMTSAGRVLLPTGLALLVVGVLAMADGRSHVWGAAQDARTGA